MNISKQYVGDQLKTVVKAIVSFLRIYEDELLEGVDVLQPGWLDYNHLYVFGNSLHQQEYKGLRKGLDAGLSTRQISNLLNSQEALGNISPLTAIEKFSGVLNGKIQADFYDHCQDIPDSSALDHTQNNLLLLDNCFLGMENKAEAYCTRGRHNNCDTIYISQHYFRLPQLSCSHKTRRISYISTLIIPLVLSQGMEQGS